ncbi:hypothetical protein [Pseudoalteromonas sp. McH1-42]|uniref:hypothetical protein n=1 Tax=Pseudoalteromonas sp. McH1-42 TaxID=2917752 RepID=UPI001EF4F9BE|nr:hypothetical protein [Pseudoalteromonas sp. McH1-42]MCG7560300.1 hypothetical protein [Pseudoalteromonas sp. McH1-42]
MYDIDSRQLLNDMEAGLGNRICDCCEEDLDEQQAIQDIAIAYVRKLSNNYNRQIIRSKGAESDLIDLSQQEVMVKNLGDACPPEMYSRQRMEFLRTSSAYEVHHGYVKPKQFALAALQYEDNLSENHVANAFLSINLLAVGSPMSEEVKRNLVLGVSIASAVLTALTATGVGAVIVLVAGILAPLILWYALRTKRDYLGIIANYSTTNLICRDFTAKQGDLHMHAGKMETFPRTTLDGVTAKEVTIRGVDEGFSDDGDIIDLIYIAQIYASKKAGFFGAEGVFALRPLDKNSPILTSLFASPYKSTPGVYITTGISGSSLKSNWHNMWGKRGSKHTVNSGGISAEISMDASQEKKVFGKLIINEFAPG